MYENDSNLTVETADGDTCRASSSKPSTLPEKQLEAAAFNVVVGASGIITFLQMLSLCCVTEDVYKPLVIFLSKNYKQRESHKCMKLHS